LTTTKKLANILKTVKGLLRKNKEHGVEGGLKENHAHDPLALSGSSFPR
jgi:hypothetical protein